MTKFRRAHGRERTDLERLSWAEKKLIACAARGRECVLGTTPPARPTRRNTIRPALIRFLALGGDSGTPVHEKGIHLKGAFVGAIHDEGTSPTLDFQACSLPSCLWLTNCRFDAAINLVDTRGPSIGFNGSAISRIVGDRLTLEGNLHLRQVHVTGEARFLGAKINGDLDCDGGQFENPLETALNCDAADIGGYVLLRRAIVIDSAHGLIRSTSYCPWYISDKQRTGHQSRLAISSHLATGFDELYGLKKSSAGLRHSRLAQLRRVL
ncbi:MAG: hypothetical protein AB7F41_04915 [Methylocystis sp.]|uniref:hypothetical protein n=1 Tax=Methylocystis sp. TaxID=1911079 RepID=UPI003D0D0F03